MIRTMIVVVLLAPQVARADAALAATDEVAKRAQALAEKTKAEERPLALAAELGFSTSQGNSETIHLNASINLRWIFAPRWLATTRGIALFERSAPAPGEPLIDTAASWAIQERVDRFLSDRFGVFAAASAERNPFAGIGSRYAGQLGVSLLAISETDAMQEGLETNHLAIDLGGYLAAEHNVTPPRTPPPPDPGDPDQTIAAARGAVDFVHRFAKGKELGANVELIQDFVDVENTLVQASAFVASSFTDVLSLKLTVADRWDNAPAPGAGRNDLIFTAGLLVNL